MYCVTRCLYGSARYIQFSLRNFATEASSTVSTKSAEVNPSAGDTGGEPGGPPRRKRKERLPDTLHVIRRNVYDGELSIARKEFIAEAATEVQAQAQAKLDSQSASVTSLEIRKEEKRYVHVDVITQGKSQGFMPFMALILL